MSDAELFIRCDCHSPEHMLILDVWHWDTERPQCSEISVHYGLDPCLSWWKRLRYGVQFILTGHHPLSAECRAWFLHEFL